MSSDGQIETDWLRPDWPAPERVKALSTTRVGGVSQPPWDSMNPACHTEYDTAHIVENRRILRQRGGLPAEPLWLTQVHGDGVVDAASAAPETRADGSFTTQPGVVCAVMTADCLPVLLCHKSGRQVAALHAGWRGLAGGVLEAGVAGFNAPGEELLAWLGPCIGPQAFEVGEEVRQAFVDKSSEMAAAFRQSSTNGRWLADMHKLARLTLAQAGVDAVYAQEDCTFSSPDRYFSYRRDGVCGRMVSLVWIEEK